MTMFKPIWRLFATCLSIVFHPLFLVTYGLLFLLVVNPYLFGAGNVSDRHLLIILVFISSFLIPVIAIILMRLLGMIDSLEIRDKQNRTGPFIITAILYLWLFINLKNQSDIPPVFNVCILGAVISLFVCFFINIFDKISIHSAGMGSMIAFALLVSMKYSYDGFVLDLPTGHSVALHLNHVIPGLLVLAGAVMSSRLYLKAHSISQVGVGFMVGFVSQIIAYQIII